MLIKKSENKLVSHLTKFGLFIFDKKKREKFLSRSC